MRWLFVAVLFVGCIPYQDPKQDPIEPKPGPDGGVADCGAMCDHLRRLGCEGAKPTPNGATCREVCEHTLEAGYDVHPECVVSVARCDQVDRASQGCGS